MKIIEGRMRVAASDVANFLACQQLTQLDLQKARGTGKTYSAARQILELVGQGRTVGITGWSHAVIENLIDAVRQWGDELGRTLRIGQKPDDDGAHLCSAATPMTNEQLERALRDGELDVAAGTAWLWARPGLAASVDTLFVDEAGQLSLANVLAISGAARDLVLLGDPQQLAQPSQATHPPGAGVSALGHILGERATIPESAGLLLNQRSSTTESCTVPTASSGRRSWARRRSPVRACAWWRYRTRATRTRHRKRPARWHGSRRCSRATHGGTGTIPYGRSAVTAS
jgi:uncharacterized protein